jgi:hypothetical protein
LRAATLKSFADRKGTNSALPSWQCVIGRERKSESPDVRGCTSLLLL